jgi:oxaloacetate decarboxylase alpha subunit
VSKLFINEETFRDGQQSLWANRMTTVSMIPAAPMIDNAGFDTVNIMSGSAFESCVLYLRENPWDRFPDDTIELLITCLMKTGIQGLVVFDGLNDIRNLKWHIDVAKKLGLQIHPALVYTLSPVHTDAYYCEKARQCQELGTTSVNLADASGLLTPARVKTLIPAILETIGDKMFSFVSHCPAGMGVDNYLEALKLGVRNISTTALPLSYGMSLPSTTEMVYHAREMGIEVAVDDDLRRRIDDYFYWVAYQEQKPVGQPVGFYKELWEKYAAHQIPGGMMSHLGSQLKGLGLEHRLPDVMVEAGRVRQELGYPVMVTPFSQMVGVQAVFNVIEGERYKTVPSDLVLYARGYYGESAAPIDQNVKDRILDKEESAPINPSENFSEPMVKKARERLGSGVSDEELLLHLFFSEPTLNEYNKNRKAIPFPVVRTPLAALVEELSKRKDLKSFAVQKDTLKMEQVF